MLMTTDYWKNGIKCVESPGDLFVGMAELISKLISNVIAYSFPVRELCPSAEDKSIAERTGIGCKCSLRTLGLAFYAYLGRIRHDCNPNAVLTFWGKVAVLKALRCVLVSFPPFSVPCQNF
jgi:hypothetical protein